MNNCARQSQCLLREKFDHTRLDSFSVRFVVPQNGLNVFERLLTLKLKFRVDTLQVAIITL